MNFVTRAIACCVLLAVSAGAWGKQPRSIELTDIAKDRSVVGKVIRVRACIGIPLFDNPDGSEEFVLLYPCGAKLDEGPPEGTIAGKFASDEVGQPFADAHITFEGEVQADFTGRLAHRQVDDRDPEKYFVLTIERVANPSERPMAD
jgi:hypothetical protein